MTSERGVLMAEGTNGARPSRDERKKQIMEVHWTLRRELPALETIAWSEARNRTSKQTMQMMRALETYRNETLRHLKFAECLVHPFLGERRAAGLMNQHLLDQRV